MLEKFKSSSFLKNTLVLVSGTSIAQVIPILISPWLTRLYSPESFGILMVYVSYISILGVIASARYEKAIILPSEENEAKKLVILSQFFIVSFCFLLAFINIFFGKQLFQLLHQEDLYPYSWLIIIGILVLGADQSYYHWANRISAYKSMSISKISSNISSGLSSLLFGYLHLEALGLILSKILGLIASTLSNLRTFSLKNFEEIKLSELKKLARAYIQFPLFLMPGHLLNAIALNGPPIVFALYYLETEVGYFALTQRVIMLPVAIIARSVGDVFRQKATEQYNTTGDFRKLYLKTLGALSLLAILPFLVLIFAAPFLFSFVFGVEWETSGSFAQVLAILFLLQFITSPLTNTFIIAGKQKLEFVWQILFLVSSILPIVLGYYWFHDMYSSLILFAISRALVYLLSIFLTLPLSTKKN